MVERRTLTVAMERFPYAKPFHITGHVFTESAVVVVTIADGLHAGRGEASGAYYLGDTVETMVAAIEQMRGAIEKGLSREALQAAMPAGGARNAVDCALWEFDARRTGTPVWKMAGLPEPRRLLTTFTLGAATPEIMAQGARDFATARALKLKLTGELDLDAARVRAVRAARPDCWIGVDANQGYGIADLPALVDILVAADVRLLEQPLARGREADLDGFESPIPIAADESVLGLADVDAAVGRFQTINIKLDKCGGLTEGLAMAHRARSLGLEVMVGNMMGSSRAMAPSYLVGQLCDIVDLDGPTFLARDRVPGIAYEDGYIRCGEDVWGHQAPGHKQHICNSG